MIRGILMVIGCVLAGITVIALLLMGMAFAMNLGSKLIFNKDCTVTAENVEPFVVKQNLLNVYSAGDATVVKVSDHWFWAGTSGFVGRDVRIKCK